VALAVSLAAVAGLAGAVQVAVMGELGERVGVLPALAFSGLLTMALAFAMLLVVKRSVRGVGDVLEQPVWLWTGGALSLLIVLAITVAGPRVGVAATLALVITGNLVMGAVIDRFGLFGLDRIPLSWTRALGLLLLGAGAAMSLHGR
jgi:bacterial/archaeal transporter family-2 protein